MKVDIFRASGERGQSIIQGLVSSPGVLVYSSASFILSSQVAEPRTLTKQFSCTTRF
jgi:hypothetical protein